MLLSTSRASITLTAVEDTGGWGVGLGKIVGNVTTLRDATWDDDDDDNNGNVDVERTLFPRSSAAPKRLSSWLRDTLLYSSHSLVTDVAVFWH